MTNADIRISISGSTSSADDWARAMAAPDSDLPKLNDEQRLVAGKFGIAESEYARGILVHEIGERRQIERGEELGRRVAQLLEGLRPDYRLTALLRKGVDGVWLARIEGHGRVSIISIPMEIADDVVDSGDVEVLEKLRDCLLRGLNRLDVSAAS
jgi:hypothetical protein